MSEEAAAKGRRIAWLDIARGVALIAMAIYHLAWDLEFFGYAPPGMTAVGGWKLFARSIAGSFLFLVGFSLFLAHAKGVRWPSFWRRFAMVALSAAAITIVTWFATPGNFIFFGILHQIAFASLAGLLFLQMPAAIVFAIGVAIIAIGNLWSTPLLDNIWLSWIGLSETRPRSSDFVPVFPWFGVVLIGIAAAMTASRYGITDRLRALVPGKWTSPLSFIGQHSLAFYLIHQPVLIALVWVMSQIIAPPPPDRYAAFVNSCQLTCRAERSETFCGGYCACVTEGLQSEGRLDEAFSPNPGVEFRERLSENVLLCTEANERPTTDQ